MRIDMAAAPKVNALLMDGVSSIFNLSTLPQSLMNHSRGRGRPRLSVATIVDSWPLEYQCLTRKVTEHPNTWRSPEELHLESLRRAIGGWALQRCTQDDVAYMAQADAWHHVLPLEGVEDALIRLKGYLVAPFVNASHRLITELIQANGLSVTRIITPEEHQIYKPHPNAYLGAAAAIGMNPSEIMVCGTVNEGLAHARRHGFRTGFWPGADAVALQDWDVVSQSVTEFAATMAEAELWVPSRAA